MKCGFCQMSLRRLVDFKEEYVKSTSPEEYAERLAEARTEAFLEYTVRDLQRHQNMAHTSSPTVFEEQAPTYKDLFGRRR